MRAWFVPMLLIACTGSPDVGGGPATPADPPSDPLPSWNDGPSREAILAFVDAVTTPGPDFVEPAARIAVFDNDGTLWAEQPFYFQADYAHARVKALAPLHADWQTQQPFAAILSGDEAAIAASGMEGFVQVTLATHGEITIDEFDQSVRGWMATARHPRFDKPYTECVYQPMQEVLAYLRANGFQTWIVTGGGQEFLRVFSEGVYGVPPEQVIGSRVKKAYEVREGISVIVQKPEIEFVNDKDAKPIGIQVQIGRQPIVAFGNSDGDRAMLEYTTSGPGKRLGVLIHHTDEVREWAYDRESPIGHLEEALDQATQDGWVVVDMKSEWSRVFPFDPAP